ncbi:uncharacterized protein [Panulirus ornatus]|uniref:uncharacterized protein isoform X2 n=1 Tax=Panulirus ornatus TaxID=150431 RepID=UPI003A8B30C3
MSSIMKVVGVIGGGAAGLCAARHILATSSMLPVVWEQSSQIGGTWVYTPRLGEDEHGLPIHSSMYKNLKTNLPKEVMAFPDYPFPPGEESFLHHTEVCKYLESYAEHYNIHPHIKFGHNVEQVTPVMRDEGPTAWAVTVKNLASKTSSTTTCDALLVCNGHYSVPQVPQIKNIQKFKGRQIHSHNYREPLPFRGSTIVVLGAGASGLDITLELASVAKNVLLSHNLPVQIPSELPANVRQVRGVVAALDNGFVFADGSSAEADVIVYCTGYKYSFPFLTDDCGITVEENVVKPLYKHLINAVHPSMAFIGIPFMICPFPLFDFQVQYFMAMMTGKLTLPSSMEMEADTMSELHHRRPLGYNDKYFHRFGFTKQIDFMNEVAEQIKIPSIKPSIKKALEIVLCRIIFSFQMFKKYQYRVVSDSIVREVCHGKVVNTSWDLRRLMAKQLVRLLWRDFFRVVTLLGTRVLTTLKRIIHH